MATQWERTVSTRVSAPIIRKPHRSSMVLIETGQGRLDGAICEYTEADKMEFLKKCFDLGIVNIEMEASMFASVTQKIGVKAGDVCVTIVNRLNGDQVRAKYDLCVFPVKLEPPI